MWDWEGAEPMRQWLDATEDGSLPDQTGFADTLAAHRQSQEIYDDWLMNETPSSRPSDLSLFALWADAPSNLRADDDFILPLNISAETTSDGEGNLPSERPDKSAIDVQMTGTPDPDGPVTQVDDVIVNGVRTITITVFWPVSIPELPQGEAAEVPPEPAELTPCQQEQMKDAAALAASEILNSLPDDREWGMYLVRDLDGSIRAVGPIEGNEEGQIDWNMTRAQLGIRTNSQIVGLVHTHFEEPGLGLGQDDLRDRFSQHDVNTNNAFVAGGADPEFRQYLTVDGETFQFETDAERGDQSNDQVDGSGCDN